MLKSKAVMITIGSSVPAEDAPPLDRVPSAIKGPRGIPSYSSADVTPFQAGGVIFGRALLRAVITLILAVLACVPARANDSTAELATGGLVFTRNLDVEMRAEDFVRLRH